MAQCRAEGRKHSTAMDLYVGILHSKLHTPNLDSEWPSYGDPHLTPPSSFSHRLHPEPASSDPSSRSFRTDARRADPSLQLAHHSSSRSCDLSRTVNSPEVHGIGRDSAKPAITHGDSAAPSARSNVSDLMIGSKAEKGDFSWDPSLNASDHRKQAAAPRHLTSLSSSSATRKDLAPASFNGDAVDSSSVDQADRSTRIHKSAEQTVANCRTHNASASDNYSTRLYKSGEQAAAKSNSNGGNVREGSSNGGLVMGSLKLGAGCGSADSSSSGSPKATRRWSSADSPLCIHGISTARDGGARRSSFSHGGSSDGGSPLAKDLWRRSSTGGYGFPDPPFSSGGASPSSGKDVGSRSSVLNSKDGSSSPNVRGMGNILGGGSVGGNLIKSKISHYKPGPNDKTECASKKPDETTANPSAASHSIHSSMGNICAGKWNPTGSILSHGTVLRSSSKTTEDSSRNGCQMNDPEEIKNAGNEHYKKQNYAEAVALYEKSIALCPNHAPYRSNRAAALIGLGRFGEAVLECEEAIRLDPQYTRAHQRAASLYLKLGLIESAKRHLAAISQAAANDMQSLQMVQRHISRCIEARKLCNWRSVLLESKAAITAGADSAPQVLGYKSEALLKLHKLEEARDVCAQAQKLEASLHKLGVAPADAFLHMLRAHIDMSLGRFDDAINAAESATKLDPRNSEATALLRKARAVGQTRMLGNELFKAGKFFEACAAYGEGLESDPRNAVLLCNRAACRSKLGQYEKAIEDCDAALGAQPNYIKALMRRANCNAKLERWEDALRDYEVLRREMPNDMEVARGFFDVQVAIKKSRGEEIHKMRFGGDVEEVFGRDHFREIIDSPGLSVVEFFTRQNDRCREISPFIDQLSKRYPCVHFVKVDVDENPLIAKAESLSFVPTFKIYKNGQKLKDILGPSQQALEYAVRHYSL